MWSHWSPWQACTVTCGVGYKTRTRTCTNPAPKWSGQDCIGMHISSNNCNLEKCKGTRKQLFLITEIFVFFPAFFVYYFDLWRHVGVMVSMLDYRFEGRWFKAWSQPSYARVLSLDKKLNSTLSLSTQMYV